MSSSQSEETKEAALKKVREVQEAGVSTQIRRAILDHSLRLCMIPEGLSGQIEMALHIDRRVIVVEKLREIATSLEKGFNV